MKISPNMFETLSESFTTLLSHRIPSSFSDSVRTDARSSRYEVLIYS